MLYLGAMNELHNVSEYPWEDDSTRESEYGNQSD